MRLAQAVLVPALSTYSAMLVSIAEASLPTNSSVGLIGFGRSRRAVHHWAEQAELPIEPIMPPFDGLGIRSHGLSVSFIPVATPSWSCVRPEASARRAVSGSSADAAAKPSKTAHDCRAARMYAMSHDPRNTPCDVHRSGSSIAMEVAAEFRNRCGLIVRPERDRVLPDDAKYSRSPLSVELILGHEERTGPLTTCALDPVPSAGPLGQNGAVVRQIALEIGDEVSGSTPRSPRASWSPRHQAEPIGPILTGQLATNLD